ncbi:MAG TPA: metallopeptidase family protein [Patescibacteria group bacterium]|nr:metallopeptidase family protein [Patescibacteria group bacterium]
MLDISDKQFDELISQALDELPQQFVERLNNVAIVYQDEPNADQQQKLALRCDQLLLGLYEGIPLTKRGAGYNLVLPDKITIFKKPILAMSADIAALKRQIKHTLWHEIAHFFGLDHDRIHEIEKRWKVSQ